MQESPSYDSSSLGTGEPLLVFDAEESAFTVVVNWLTALHLDRGGLRDAPHCPVWLHVPRTVTNFTETTRATFEEKKELGNAAAIDVKFYPI